MTSVEGKDVPAATTEAPAKLAVPRPPSSTALHRAGFAITATWLAALAVYMIVQRDLMAGLAPNELGDFAAGAAAPLAFLWLVLGFFQQGQELRHSGEALWLQGQELQHSVEQQRELVEVTRAQLTFDSELKERERIEAIRDAQPVLGLRPGGSSPSGSPGSRHYTFWLLNSGKPCTRVVISERERGEVTSADLLGTGQRTDFVFAFPPEGAVEALVYVSFLDSRGAPGTHQFLVRRDAGSSRFEIEDIEPPAADERDD